MNGRPISPNQKATTSIYLVPLSELPYILGLFYKEAKATEVGLCTVQDDWRKNSGQVWHRAIALFDCRYDAVIC